ncbi:MAG: HU family DNA-binding protein [Bacilli bacterium]|nr:HU family DNA-binding protein [Bacilli bacterium]
MQKINKKDLVEVVAEEGHLSKKDSRVAVDLVFDLMEKSLLSGQEVNVTNFGVFTPKTKQERDGTDPRSHKRIVIKKKNTIVFRPSKQLKGKLNK